MNKVLLTFDVEEFDVPEEFGQQLDFHKQIEVSTIGLQQVLSLLEKHQVTCTFFTTARYALEQPELMKLIAETHEIASHGYAHSSFKNSDLKKSKETLEALLDHPIRGYRMARLAPVDDREIEKAGYTYNSSMNPTWIPGRYNHLRKPRVPFMTGKVLNIPTSVTPLLRIPLFWLSFKNFPMWMLRRWMLRTLRHDGFLSLYFHPWEFTDIRAYGLPAYISRHSGDEMLQRLDETIKLLKNEAEFTSMNAFAKSYKP
jgi:peptidoglycan/xylan/chitin deacetylase (PgdA/CDA1 family)